MLAFRIRIQVCLGGHPVDSVFLHLAGRHLLQRHVPKERDEMHPEPNGMALGPFLGPLALVDNTIFLDELLRGLPEGRAVLEDADPKFPSHAW